MNGESKSMVLYERAAMATIPDAQNLRAIATDLLNSGLYPSIKNATQAIAVIATGQEIGLGPTASLTYIAPVNGRMTMESKLMLALFHRAGGRSKILKRDNLSCKIEFSKPGRDPFVFEYTAEMAKTEQLWDKPTWKKMPATQLQWRAVSNGIKAYDPGVIMGIAMSAEEAQDYPAGLPEEGQESQEPIKKKGPGRPKAEKPTPEAAPEPEKTKEAPKQAKSEGFDAASEEIAGMAESEETDSEEELVIGKIKAVLEEEGIDIKKFKLWLWETQPRMKKTFLVKLGKALRFHGAIPEDLEYLLRGISGAVALFRNSMKEAETDSDEG